MASVARVVSPGGRRAPDNRPGCCPPGRTGTAWKRPAGETGERSALLRGGRQLVDRKTFADAGTILVGGRINVLQFDLPRQDLPFPFLMLRLLANELRHNFAGEHLQAFT